jgi:anti-anti-sigma regulatory factor
VQRGRIPRTSTAISQNAPNPSPDRWTDAAGERNSVRIAVYRGARDSATDALIHVTDADRESGVKLVQVEGDLRAGDAMRFRRSLASAAAAGRGGLVVDLRGCRFVSRACASAVADAADDLQRAGGHLRVVTPPESVLESALAGAWRSKLWIHHTIGAAVAEGGAFRLSHHGRSSNA